MKRRKSTRPRSTKQDAAEFVRAQFAASAEVKQRTGDTCAADIIEAAAVVARAMAKGGKLLLCGNGGSAADCQHMAAEFVSRLTMNFVRPGLPAIALTTDTSFLTAYANDIDFEGVFARQVQALGRRGDVLLAISTSGRSKNVVKAVEQARTSGLRTIVLMGSAGVLAELVDVAIKVPSQSTQFIQESHLAIEHAICHLVERQLYGDHGVTP